MMRTIDEEILVSHVTCRSIAKRNMENAESRDNHKALDLVWHIRNKYEDVLQLEEAFGLNVVGRIIHGLTSKFSKHPQNT